MRDWEQRTQSPPGSVGAESKVVSDSCIVSGEGDES